MMKANQDEQALTLRLKQVSQLRRVCLSLGKSVPANPSELDPVSDDPVGAPDGGAGRDRAPTGPQRLGDDEVGANDKISSG